VPEFVVPVRFVHQGTGWVVEGELSTRTPLRLDVPYAGTWDVFINGDPTVLAQVETNTGGPQMILWPDCPLVCEVPPPVEEPPPFLPKTGGPSFFAQLVGSFAFGLIVIGASLLIYTIVWLKIVKREIN
jgi:hypothetical protein